MTVSNFKELWLLFRIMGKYWLAGVVITQSLAFMKKSIQIRMDAQTPPALPLLVHGIKAQKMK